MRFGTGGFAPRCVSFGRSGGRVSRGWSSMGEFAQAVMAIARIAAANRVRGRGAGMERPSPFEGAPSGAGACDHCGDSLAGLKIVQRQLGASLRDYCCNGCAFIAEQLFLAQAGARDREALTTGLGASETAAVA